MPYRIPRALGLLVVALLTAVPARSDELTLAQAIALALSNHPAPQVRALELSAASAHLRGARARPTPELRLTPGLVGSEPTDELLSFSQPLEINGARRARTQIAGAQVAESQGALELAREALLLEVKLAYGHLALSEQILRLDQENLQYAETLAAAAQTQFDLGNQPQVQVFGAELEVARARRQVYRSQAAADQARASLNAALGRDPALPVTLREALAPPAPSFDETALPALGLARRPELRQAQALVAEAEGELAAARSARRPELALQARLTPEGQGGVALSLSLPHLDGGSLRAQEQRAAALLAAREREVEAVRNTVRLDIADALTAFRAAQAQTRVFEEQVLRQSRRLTDLALLGYQEGATSFLEVLEARRTLRAVNVDYFNAVAEQVLSLARLEWGVGGDLRGAPAAQLAGPQEDPDES